MAVKRLTIKRTSFLDYADVFRNVEEFRTGGALKGIHGLAPRYGASYGRLGDNPSAAYNYVHDEERIVYTVISWNTPIAWLRNDGKWFFNAYKYSVSTSTHQNKIIAALAMIGEPVIYS